MFRLPGLLRVLCLFVFLIPPVSLADSLVVNFDAAYDNEGIASVFVDMNGAGTGNGIPDLVELAVISSVLADAGLDLGASGGLTHSGVHAAFSANYSRMQLDLAAASVNDPDACLILAGFMTLGGDNSVQWASMLASFLNSAIVINPADYNRGQAPFLENTGDADGDDGLNQWEYVFEQQIRSGYLVATLDTDILSIPMDVDFDAVMAPLPPGIDLLSDGIPEADEFALLRAILTTPSLDLSATGGLTHALVAAAWRANYLQACEDLGVGDDGVPLVAALASIGTTGWDPLAATLTSSSITAADYDASASAFLTPTGNADGDAASNRIEYCLEGEDRAAWLAGALNASRVSIPLNPDFDAAIAEEFPGWPEADVNGNTIPEERELAVIRQILQTPALDLSGRGGITHAQVVTTWNTNYLQALADTGCNVLESLLAAGYMMLGDVPSVTIASSNLGAAGSYDNTLEPWLSGSADADHDAFSNREESRGAADRAAYLAAVLDPASLPIPMPPDFDEALANVFGFNDGDMNGAVAGTSNDMRDSDELALLGAILANDALDLSSTGGVTHAAVAAVWRANFIQVHADLAAQMPNLRLNSVLAGLITLGDAGSFALAAFVASDFGVTLSAANCNQTLAGHLACTGDADGDGGANTLEYAQEGRHRPAYLTAALDQVLLTPPLNIDFDPLLTATFGSTTVDMNANNFPDAHELALLSAILANPALDLTATGGISHAQVAAAWRNNYLHLHADTVAVGATADEVALFAGYGLLDATSLGFGLGQFYTRYGILLASTPYQSLPDAIGLWGDADGDAGPNATEFYLEGQARAAYLAAALNAGRYHVPMAVNFDSIFLAYFGSLTQDLNGDGLADSDEFALLGAVLTEPTLDLSPTGGLTYAQAVNAWKINFGAVSKDIGLPYHEEEVAFAAAYITMGDMNSFNLASIFGVHSPPPLFEQSLVLFLPATSDADGDGFTNAEERAFVTERAPYLALALDAAACPIPFDVDFDAALNSVGRPYDIDFTSPGDPVLEDGSELALLAYILTHPAINLSATGGVTHAQVAAAWRANFAQAHHDLATQMPDEDLNTIVAGYITLGSPGAWAVAQEIAGVPLNPANYDRLLAALLPERGDADGDGIRNAMEYRLENRVRASYYAGALDASRITVPTVITPASDPTDYNGPNGIPDNDEMALLAAVLASPGLDLTATGGVTHAGVLNVWRNNFIALLRACGDVIPSTGNIIAGTAYFMAGDTDSVNTAVMLANLYYEITLDPAGYDVSLRPLLAFDGDADGDGVVNRNEYDFQGRQRTAYVSAALNPAVTGIPMAPDFDAALDAVFGGHAQDHNGATAGAPNTMPDADELALVRAVLDATGLDLSSTGGVTHAMAAQAWTDNICAAHHALALTLETHPGLDVVVAGLATLGDAGSMALALERAAAAGVVLSGGAFNASMGAYLSRGGDADGDGASNGVEYLIEGSLRPQYLIAALDQVAVTVPLEMDFDAVITSVHQTYFPQLPEPIESQACVHDADAFAVLSRLLGDDRIDLTANGGVSHALVVATWRDNYLHLHADLAGIEPPVSDDALLLGAACITLGDPDTVFLVRDLADQMSGVVINTDLYDTSLGAYLGDAGDADGDGIDNAIEYDIENRDREGYVAAVLDPNALSIPLTYEFDPAIEEYLELAGGLSADLLDSGMPDAFQLALLSRVLEDPGINLDYSGGITHAQAQAAWQANYMQFFRDADGTDCVDTQGFALVVGFLGYFTGADFSDYNTLLAASGLGAVDASDYDLYLSPYIRASGDADSDGYTNLQEYLAFGVTKSREAYVEAALDPTIVPDTHGPAPVISGPATLTNKVRRLTIDFGQVVNGFDLLDIMVTDGEPVAIEPGGPASSYTVDIQGVGDTIVKIYIPVGAATDGTGNLTMPCVDHFEFPFDEVAPSFSGLQAYPACVGPNRATQISFNADEALQEPPAMLVNGSPAAFTAQQQNHYTFTYVAPQGGPLGLAQIEIEGMDMAGNTGHLADASVLEIVAVDYGLPLRAWPLSIALALAAMLSLTRARESRGLR